MLNFSEIYNSPNNNIILNPFVCPICNIVPEIVEIHEELGKEIEIIKYISTIENFFEMNNIKYHEILFVYQAEFVEDMDKKIESTLENVEGKEFLHYEWIDLDKIEQYPLLPKVLKRIIKENEFPVHKIEKNY